jgi:hypothetical protein
MKITSIAQIAHVAGAAGEAAGAKGSGDIITRINETINNFKDLAKLARGMQEGAREPEVVVRDVPNQKPPVLPAVNILEAIVNSPLGDVPLGNLIGQLGPYTLKQLKEMARNAGLKK